MENFNVVFFYWINYFLLNVIQKIGNYIRNYEIYINDETKDAKLNMKIHYIITYNDNQNYNKINLGIIANNW